MRFSREVSEKGEILVVVHPRNSHGLYREKRKEGGCFVSAPGVTLVYRKEEYELIFGQFMRESEPLISTSIYPISIS